MFSVAKEARITPNDFAKALGVSRVTASLWYNGHNSPHHLIRKRVEETLGAVKRGIETGDFPVPYEIPRRERFLYIQKVIKKNLVADAPSVSE